MKNLSTVQWIKSSRSQGDGNCVEVAFLADSMIWVRDSKNPTGPALIFGTEEWDGFLAGLTGAGFGAAPDPSPPM
ncbi:DUF397 domain-containing protein [Nocardia speluncae]|uniref:DUF397 domain-containing protein n=1 Tax=Nocardia speluncae TaxID=419477 RepID=A0A846XHR3_9NOCA|nr:DUF397 domain-containing protein [Nocardia speluncae]NKY34240.1 DUF397 domain-containing protein [Nocardia speluncae]